MKKTKTSKTGSKVGMAVAGLAATALAGAGTWYFYGSKKAKEHRKDTVAWMKKAEKEVVTKAKKLKSDAVNSAEYKKIVAEVAKKYSAIKSVDANDLKDFAHTLTKSWKHIEKDLVKKVQSIKEKGKAKKA